MERLTNHVLHAIDSYGEGENPEHYEKLKRIYFMFPVLGGSYLPLNNRFSKISVIIFQFFKTSVSLMYIVMLATAAVKIFSFSKSLSLTTVIILFILCLSVCCNILLLSKRRDFYQCNEIALGVNLSGYSQDVNPMVKQRIQQSLKVYEWTLYAAIVSFFIGGSVMVFIRPLLFEIESHVVGGVHFYSGIPLWYSVNFSSDQLTNDRIWHVITICQLYAIGVDVSMGILTYINIIGGLIKEIDLLVESVRYTEERAIASYRWLYGAQRSWVSELQMYGDQTFLKCYSQCLIENVKHHQKIIRNFNECAKYICVPIVVVIFILTLNISFGLLVLRSNEHFYTTKVIVLLDWINIMSVVTVMTLYGQKCADLGDDLREAIYDLKWYHCNKETKTLIKIMQLGASKPLILKALMIPITLNTLGDIFKSAYSYYNIAQDMHMIK